MDIVLEVLDRFFFDRVYATVWPVASSVLANGDAARFGNASAALVDHVPPVGNQYQFQAASKYFSVAPSQYAYVTSVPRDNSWRQFSSLFITTWFFGILLYFIFGSLSYLFVFDHETKNHPRYLRNQIWLEIQQSMSSMPGMSVLTAMCFLLEVRGYSKIYDATQDGPGVWYTWLQFPLFIIFTDCLIYWIHRGLHHPMVYKRLHKPHHKWIMPTPFSSHAFHPLDGFAQSIPYHLFPFLLPLQKWAYVVLFVFINFWTILIHDGEYMTNNAVINGAACHSLHHLAFNWNYGQFTTLWDRLGGSYRAPEQACFDKKEKMCQKTWEKQVNEMQVVVREVEGEDDRHYLPEKKSQ